MKRHYAYAACSRSSDLVLAGTVDTELEEPDLTIYILGKLAGSAIVQKFPWDPFNLSLEVREQGEPKR